MLTPTGPPWTGWKLYCCGRSSLNLLGADLLFLSENLSLKDWYEFPPFLKKLCFREVSPNSLLSFPYPRDELPASSPPIPSKLYKSNDSGAPACCPPYFIPPNMASPVICYLICFIKKLWMKLKLVILESSKKP